MTFAGFLTFLDRPKAGVTEAIAGLASLGVSIKLITGDSRLVAEHVASLVGLGRGRDAQSQRRPARWWSGTFPGHGFLRIDGAAISPATR